MVIYQIYSCHSRLPLFVLLSSVYPLIDIPVSNINTLPVEKNVVININPFQLKKFAFKHIDIKNRLLNIRKKYRPKLHLQIVHLQKFINQGDLETNKGLS